MPHYVFGSTPIQGHVAPMLAIAAELIERGHRVTVITGSRFRDAVEAVGATHRPLTGAADYDDRLMTEDDEDDDLPESKGLQLMREGMETIFVVPMREQSRAVERAIDDLAPDAILVDSAFVGAVPLLLDDPLTRPPVLAAGVVPLAQSSADVAPVGLGLAPATSPAGRLRNRALNVLIAKGRVPARTTSRRWHPARPGPPTPRSFRTRLLGAVRPLPPTLTARVRVPPPRPDRERALRRIRAARGSPSRGRRPRGGRSSTTVGRSCTSARARSSTGTWTSSCVRRSMPSRIMTCWSSPRREAAHWPTSARCPPMRVPPSSCRTAVSSRRPTSS